MPDTYFEAEADAWAASNLTQAMESVGGDAQARTILNAIATAVPPIAIAQPTISGTPQVGQTLTAAHGTYLAPPTGYTYQWLRNGSTISGAIGLAYVLQSADGGTGVSFRETPSNAKGAGSANVSIPISVTSAGGSLPYISGIAARNRTINLTPGTVGSTVQLYKDGAVVSGATGPTYTIPNTNSEVGSVLFLRETTVGNTTIDSAPIVVGITERTSPFTRAGSSMILYANGSRKTNYEGAGYVHGTDFWTKLTPVVEELSTNKLSWTEEFVYPQVAIPGGGVGFYNAGAFGTVLGGWTPVYQTQVRINQLSPTSSWHCTRESRPKSTAHASAAEGNWNTLFEFWPTTAEKANGVASEDRTHEIGFLSESSAETRSWHATDNLIGIYTDPTGVAWEFRVNMASAKSTIGNVDSPEYIHAVPVDGQPHPEITPNLHHLMSWLIENYPLTAQDSYIGGIQFGTELTSGGGYGHFKRTLEKQGTWGVATGPFRLVPNGTHEFFVVAPHANVGAIALHYVNGNGSGGTVPGGSIGGFLGGWRVKGIRRLAAFGDNPISGAAEVIFEGLAAWEYAINFGSGGFGGAYHGYGSTSGSFYQSVPETTVGRPLSIATNSHEAVIGWNEGSASVKHFRRLNTDGSIASRTTLTMSHDPLTAFVAMATLGPAFTRMSLNLGSTWSDISNTGSADVTHPADVDEVWFRNPTTGLVVKVYDDARALGSTTSGGKFREKYVTSRVVGNTDRKLYTRVDKPDSGSQLGTIVVNQKIDFAITTPG